jgi:diacylglycerol kinase family enzyme
MDSTSNTPTAKTTAATPGPIRKVAVVVNARAGTVLQMGTADFTRAIVEAFRARDIEARVITVPGKQLRRRLHEVLDGPYDTIIVSGGDGTLSRMLPELLATDKRVGVLPLGTLNLFGADLGLSTDIPATIAAIAGGETRAVDIGLINGVPFHSISGVGYSAMMARERERARRQIPFSKALSFLWAAARTLLYTKPMLVDVLVDGEHRIREADGVLITNNRFDGIPWRRGSIEDGTLEVHTFKAHGLWNRLKTLWAVARGRWREVDTLESTTTTDVTLRRRDKRRVIVATDGEIQLMRGDLHYEIKPKALTILAAPKPEDAA